MSESGERGPTTPEDEQEFRCPNCDSVVSAGDAHCLMCGTILTTPAAEPGADLSEVSAVGPVDLPATAETPPVVVSIMKERHSRATFWFTAVFAILIVVLGGLVLRFQGPLGTVALVPTGTFVPPTLTYTPTWTPLPTDVPLPTASPTNSPTPAPTDTPRPPRFHQVNAGETLTGLSLRYRVSVESIAAASDVDPDSPIRVGQDLQIPWPTATPPLVPVVVTVRGVNVVADPTDCERHEVRGGDTLLKIAAQNDVDLELLLRVNRLSEETILLPGDSICIPEIVIGATLPATPGPTPTITPTSPPPGPQLLYPIQNAVVGRPDGVVALQWAAVKDLDPAEWYMIEVTDLDEVDSLPHRGFTRDTSFQLPQSWRPTEAESHLFRWRVSIVQVTGQRSDGVKIYRYGGESSEEAFFRWLGAVPTATPTLTPTPATAP